MKLPTPHPLDLTSAQGPVTSHLEIETYTWSVLPASYQLEIGESPSVLLAAAGDHYGHPNVVKVHDYVTNAEGAFYTMEYLVGDDLRGAAPLGYREACGLIRDVCSALCLVHSRRLVHRDVTRLRLLLQNSKLVPLEPLSEDHCQALLGSVFGSTANPCPGGPPRASRARDNAHREGPSACADRGATRRRAANVASALRAGRSRA